MVGWMYAHSTVVTVPCRVYKYIVAAASFSCQDSSFHQILCAGALPVTTFTNSPSIRLNQYSAAMATSNALDPSKSSEKTMKLENTEKRDKLIAIEKKYQVGEPVACIGKFVDLVFGYA